MSHILKLPPLYQNSFLPPGRFLRPHVLSEVLSHATEMGRKNPLHAIIIFDLDSTLLDNRSRQARIVREFGEFKGIPELNLCTPQNVRCWSLKDSMINCGLSVERATSLEPEARSFWLERFFQSEYCKDDVQVSGAVDYVNRILQTRCKVVYLTGRHDAMREGTVESFKTEGFPLPDDHQVYLLMKPTFEMHDDDWKEQAYHTLHDLGHAIAFFDNEPTHINSYHQAFPDATCVHLLTDDSGRGVSVRDAVPSIHDFIMQIP